MESPSASCAPAGGNRKKLNSWMRASTAGTPGMNENTSVLYAATGLRSFRNSWNSNFAVSERLRRSFAQPATCPVTGPQSVVDST